MTLLPSRIVLASGNTGKLKELQDLLAPLKVGLVRQSELNIDDADETGLTFVENAILKARHASRLGGLPAIADDSGLAVDALGGAPGIYSARYAEDELYDADATREQRDAGNNQKLLQAMTNVEDTARGAQFHCVVVFVQHPEDPVPIVCHGQWAGNILHRPAGEGGFGYDPLFWVPEMQCSSAQLSADTKNRISHRGQAMRLLLARLQELAPHRGPGDARP